MPIVASRLIFCNWLGGVGSSFHFFSDRPSGFMSPGRDVLLGLLAAVAAQEGRDLVARPDDLG